MDDRTVAEQANMTPDEWHKLAIDVSMFAFFCGLALGALIVLLVWRPW